MFLTFFFKAFNSEGKGDIGSLSSNISGGKKLVKN